MSAIHNLRRKLSPNSERSINSPIPPTMPATFLDLPSEPRNKIYEQLLVLQEPIDPWVDYNQRENLTPRLLRANKTVRREASSVLYALQFYMYPSLSRAMIQTQKY